MTTAPYFKIAVSKPESTGAGVVSKIEDADGGAPKNADYMHKHARALARMFICRAVAFFLMSMALFAFLSYVSISQTTDLSAKFLTSIAIVTCLLQGMAWRQCSKVREELWYPARSVVVEMMADAWRLGSFTITYPLMVLALYALANRPEGYEGKIFQSPEAAAATAAVNGLLLAVVRLGTDEVWDIRPYGGFAAWLGGGGSLLAATCLFLVCFDFGNASSDIDNGYFVRSFVYVYIGSAGMAAIAGIARLVYGRCFYKGPYHGEYPPGLSLVKDLVYGLIDCWALGVFALWVGYTNFGKKLWSLDGAVPFERGLIV